MTKTDLAEIERLVKTLWPAVSMALKGKKPSVQAGVLADLTATWLAGHVVPGDKAATAELQEELLAIHVEYIRQLAALENHLRERADR